MVPHPRRPLLLLDEAFDDVPRIVHAFTTRRGGVSEGPFASLNFSLQTGDNRENVWENQRRVLAALGLQDRVLVRAEQPHGSRAQVVDERFALTPTEGVQIAPGVDALITNRDDVALLLTFADCVPILLASGDGSCVALAHAGWRGVAANVARATVDALREGLAVEAQQLHACIGPAIEGRCYEVSDEVLTELRRSAPGGEVFWAESRTGRALVDLRSAVRAQLVAAGVSPERISVDEHCTACDEELFFSRRRQGKPHGTMAAVMAIRRRRDG